ncbi:hypothetical protein ACFRCX_37855, partial [Streptomyces sp. NPDC056652]
MSWPAPLRGDGSAPKPDGQSCGFRAAPHPRCTPPQGWEQDLTERRPVWLRPARKGGFERAGAHLFKPLWQGIASINQTFKGRLDLERQGG